MTEHTGGTRIRTDLAAVVAVLAVAGPAAAAHREVTWRRSARPQPRPRLLQPVVASAQNWSGRLRPLHALPPGAELARPRTATGGFDKSKLTLQQLGAGSSRVQAARSACHHLLPNGGRAEPGPGAAGKAQALEFLPVRPRRRRPELPRPDSSGRIPDPASLGIDQGSPTFQAANQACREYRPPYFPPIPPTTPTSGHTAHERDARPREARQDRDLRAGRVYAIGLGDPACRERRRRGS